jgi:hypothetical protein
MFHGVVQVPGETVLDQQGCEVQDVQQQLLQLTKTQGNYNHKYTSTKIQLNYKQKYNLNQNITRNITSTKIQLNYNHKYNLNQNTTQL